MKPNWDFARYFIRPVLVLTMALGILPFIPYTWQKFNGMLPSEQQWNVMQGGPGKHGPWYDQEPLKWMLLLPLIALFLLGFLTLLSSLAVSIGNRRALYAAQGLGVLVVQIAIFCLQGTLFWLVD